MVLPVPRAVGSSPPADNGISFRHCRTFPASQEDVLDLAALDGAGNFVHSASLGDKQLAEPLGCSKISDRRDICLGFFAEGTRGSRTFYYSGLTFLH